MNATNKLASRSAYEPSGELTIAELFGLAEALEAKNNTLAATVLYKNWIANNSSNPLLHAAYFNYGTALNKYGDRSGAINALRECLRIKRDFLPPYINLGRLLEDDGQAGAAISQWLALVEYAAGVNGDTIKHKLLALQQVARVLEGFQQDASAEDALRQALDINAGQPEVIQHWISLRQRQCKWPVIDGWENVGATTLAAGISPLSLAVLDDDPMFQLARGYKYSCELIGRPKAPLCPRNVMRQGPRPTEKLRIGYVSSDLREHAVGFAMTDVLECHDRRSFEIFAYYCGIDRVDQTQIRSRASVDRWTDINPMSDQEAAATINKDRIDILVDLNGNTKDARSRVFAYRPAPIIVNWFGFPGTMGSIYHDYIVADPYIIPQQDEIFYSEKVVRLDCYQPNDRKRIVATECPSRPEVGLPDDTFVYCCFNGCQKITPETLQNWIEILRQVPRSVLWLLSAIPETEQRLRQRFTENGIASDRLIFADKRPNPQHLARYALADLFLDTFPYGAHTTASDAMWMGVPVLTCPGRSFASRVCGSLVRSAGIGELVCDGVGTYVARAVELGREPSKALEIKMRLQNSRASCVLFDTPKLVADLENLYRGMWADLQSKSIRDPELINMNDYFEIGLDRVVSTQGAAAPGDIRSYYRDRLEARDFAQRLQPDSRLWPGRS